MFFILVCLDSFQQVLVRTGYASPARRAVVITLSGVYLAVLSSGSGDRILKIAVER